MTELIITNGDAAADVMAEAGFAAEILPWRDVLHEGPVPEAESLEALSAIRAGFLADAFDEPRDDVLADMQRRDQRLRAFGRYDEVTLWFEHDLYDQLQLLQLLDFFHREASTAAVHIVQADDYLGPQTAEEIRSFAAGRMLVSAEQKALAADIFAAFRQKSPAALAGFLDRDLTSLPHMKAALGRLFDDLPDSANGLSRTQRQILAVVERDSQPPKHLFAAVQAMEEAIFMGDWSFWRCLEDISFNLCPLVEGLPGRFSNNQSDAHRRCYLDAALTLSDAGKAVLAGEADHASINGIDRWLGGTHIESGTIWRWDQNAGALVAPS